MSERLLVTSAGAAEGVSFAREKIRQLRTIGADLTSRQYRYRGLTVIAKIMDDEERIIIVDPCVPVHGYLVTANFEPSEFPGGTPTTIYWATFPTFKQHKSGAMNGTHRISPSTPAEIAAGLTWPNTVQGITGTPHALEWAEGEEKTHTPKNYPTFGIPEPSSAAGTGSAARWPSLFTGYMRLVAQMALASQYGNVFNPPGHGAIPIKNAKGVVTSIWIIEIGTGGVYTAKMKARCGRPDVDQFIKDLLPKETPEELGYKLSFPDQISLSWVFNYRKDQKLVKKLSGKTYENRGSPLSKYRGWAFSYSGTCAECVLFSPTELDSPEVPGSGNAYQVEHLRLDIYMGEDGPTAANITLKAKYDPYVNDSQFLIWHPDDYQPFMWKQKEVMGAKLLHPPTKCTGVVLDVFFDGDEPQYTTVSQGKDVMAPAIVTDGAASCLDLWRLGNYSVGPCGPGGGSGSYWMKEDTSSPNSDMAGSFSTPAGSYNNMPVGGIKNSKKQIMYSGSASWLASKLFVPYVGFFLWYEQFGWAITTSSWEETTATSRTAAVVLDYFDRESMYLIQYKEDWTRSGSTTGQYWAFTDNGMRKVSNDEFNAATAGTGGSMTYPAKDVCHTPNSGRFTALGGYNTGTDPDPVTTFTEKQTEVFTISHAMPGKTATGSVKAADKFTMGQLLQYRNLTVGMSPYEDVSLYSMSSAACSIPVPPPKKPKTTATKIEGSRIVLNRITANQYEGPVPEPTGPTVYKGYAGLI